MLISIVIPTRNRCALLRNTLEALVGDKYPLKEIVVVDAASTDGTVEMLRSFGNQVRWVSEKDDGEYFARNKGFAITTGDVIHFCGDDNILLAGSFEFAAEYMTDHPEADIIFGQGKRYCEGPDGTRVLMDTRRNLPGRISARSFIRGANPNIMSDTAFFRRRVVDRIGGFDTSFLGADYEFWARSAHSGCHLVMTDHPIVEYIISMKSQVILKKKKLVIERSKLALRYGSFSDLLYVVVNFIPRQLFVNWLHRVLPWPVERALRRALWSMKDPALRTSAKS
jgi:glycosyltransferase involved in cell wall biosynthesis